MDMAGYFAAGLIALFLLVQLLPLLRARFSRGRAVPGLDRLLNDRQRAESRLLVYFWSPGCGMCRAMTPVIDALAAGRDDVIKVNTAEALAVARQFGVMATPSLAIVEKGVVQKLMVGARSGPQIRALLGAQAI